MVAKKRTYLDASILISAWQGKGEVGRIALEILDDPNREFVISDYVKLEVIPKPTFHKNDTEVEFYENVFNASICCTIHDSTIADAINLACKYDMTPVDALHVSVAKSSTVDELATCEKAEKPMCRVNEVCVVSYHTAE